MLDGARKHGSSARSRQPRGPGSGIVAVLRIPAHTPQSSATPGTATWPGSPHPGRSRRRLQDARERLLNLFLLSGRRDGSEELLEIGVRDAAPDEGVALGVEQVRVDLSPHRRAQRAVEIALQIVDVEARLLLQQTVHG